MAAFDGVGYNQCSGCRLVTEGKKRTGRGVEVFSHGGLLTVPPVLLTLISAKV